MRLALSAFSFQLSALTLSALLLTSCNEAENGLPPSTAPKAMSFSVAEGGQTRAANLNLETVVNDFRVFVTNGTFNDEGGFVRAYKVMENYVVWWNQNTANTADTNTDDWDYVGNYQGATSDAKKSSFDDAGKSAIQSQGIKFWDETQPYHVFFGLARADRGKFIVDDVAKTVSTNITMKMDDHPENVLYTEPIVVSQADYGKPVTMVFHRMCAVVRVGMYETIPGYMVKDVHFYTSMNATSATDQTVRLLGVNVFAKEQQVNLTYSVKQTGSSVTFDIVPGTEFNDNLIIGALQYASDVKENVITPGKYLNLSSSAPTLALGTAGDGKSYIMANENNDKPIAIKCDYTLVANDHANAADCEEIYVRGATAIVPPDYCKWKPNVEYTYVFKISEKTNGQTGTGPAGLYPITFDAEASSEIEVKDY